MSRIIFQTEDNKHRIIEIPDNVCSMDDLKGDTFNRSCNPDIPEEQMRKQEKDFEELIEREGVFGYVLERWNPEPDKGWEHVDSCWGFIGQYSPNDKSDLFNHYIIEELKGQIK